MESLIAKKYLRSIIFGGTDGIITIFNIISGIEGAKLKNSVVLVIGLAALISDAVSMGFSDYLSLNAENKIKKDETVDPKISGFITFSSFALFGLVPLLSYILSLKYSKKYKFVKTYISTIVSLFVLGSIQSKFTEEKWYSSGFYVSLYGIIASLISYNIGKYLKGMFE